WWELVDANAAIAMFTQTAAPELLKPPVNVLRLSLHPDGMAPRIVNLPQWRAHLLARLDRRRGRPPGRRERPPARHRRRGPAPLPRRPHRTLLPLPHRRGRHAPGHHRLRAGHRVVLPRRREHGRRPEPKKIFIYRTGTACRPPHPHHRQLVVARRGTTARSA